MKQIINIIKSLDMFVLSIFQGFSHWSYKTCELTNFWWARFCLYFFGSITCLFYIFYCYSSVHNENVEFVLLSVFIMFLLLSACLFSFFLCNAVEKYCNDSLEHDAENILTSELFPVRIWILLCTCSFHGNINFTIGFVNAFLGINGIADINIFLYVSVFSIFSLYFSVPCAFLYFVSCMPLPPSKKKVKDKERENAKLLASTA